MQVKTYLMIGAAVAAVLAAAPASAQTAFDGFYAGAGAGAQKGNSVLDLTLTPMSGGTSITNHYRASKEPTTPKATAFGGYNMSFDRWVVGGEIGYQPKYGNDRRNFAGNFLTSGPSSGLYTATARVGYLVEPDLMIYTFGGWAGQQRRTTVSAANTIARSAFSNGFTGGVGVEYALSSNMFMRGEAQYTDLGSSKGRYSLTLPTGGTGGTAVTRTSGAVYGATLSIGYRF